MTKSAGGELALSSCRGTTSRIEGGKKNFYAISLILRPSKHDEKAGTLLRSPNSGYVTITDDGPAELAVNVSNLADEGGIEPTAVETDSKTDTTPPVLEADTMEDNLLV